MDQTVIYLLIGAIAWAALLYYLFIVRRASDLGAGGKSALIIVLGIIIPILGIALWNQSQSYDRLKELGFNVYEGLGNSVGMASGGGDSPTWLYSLKTSEDDVMEFYRQPKNHSGWKLTSESADSIIFRRGQSTMLMQVNNGNASFLLYHTGNATPNKSVDSDT